MLSKLIKSAPDEIQLIEVIGRIDSDNADVIHTLATKALVQDRAHLIFDFHAVEYINSAGLRTLVQLYKHLAREGGSLIIVNPSENVIRLLKLVGLDTVFDIHFDARWNSNGAGSNQLPSASREVYYCL